MSVEFVKLCKAILHDPGVPMPLFQKPRWQYREKALKLKGLYHPPFSFFPVWNNRKIEKDNAY